MPVLIDRQAALEIAMSYCPDDDGCCSKAGRDIREMLDEIESLPNVHIDDMTFKIQNEIQAAKPSRTVEITFVRHGRWSVKILDIGDGDKIRMLQCSECSRNANMKSDFCPNCGADMRDGGADND